MNRKISYGKMEQPAVISMAPLLKEHIGLQRNLRQEQEINDL